MDRFERWKVQDKYLLQAGHGNTTAGGLDLINWRVDFNYGWQFLLSQVENLKVLWLFLVLQSICNVGSPRYKGCMSGATLNDSDGRMEVSVFKVK